MREEERPQWLLWTYVAVLVLIPTVLLIVRWATGDIEWLGWGWQMYS